MERYLRDNLLAGQELVDFWLTVFRGEPVMVKVTQLAPRRKDGKPRKVPYFIIEGAAGWPDAF